MHKPLLILLTLPRQPEWLAVCAKSWAGKEEEKEWREKRSLGREGTAVRSGAGLNNWMLTADMIEKMPLENQGVCLISVHDGLSLFRRFSVIHPSLISSFKIVFAQLHIYLHTQKHAGSLWARKTRKGCRHRRKINMRININPMLTHKRLRYKNTAAALGKHLLHSTPH